MTDHYEMPHRRADECSHAGVGKACRPCRELFEAKPAPITPDERAEWRALADAATPGPWDYYRPHHASGYYEITRGQETLACQVSGWDAEFIAAARAAVPRLLDALDTAEAETTRLREKVARLSKSLSDELRPAPVWDEDTVTEAACQAVTEVYERHGDRYQPDEEEVVTAVLAVVREHAPVRPDREAVARAVLDALNGCVDYETQYLLADAVLDLWPGESRATVQAEALRDAADEWHAEHYGTRPAAYKFLWDRADRLDPRGADRG